MSWCSIATGRCSGAPVRDAARRPRLLILGGTTEARELAEILAARHGAGLDVVSAQAGRMHAPRAIAGALRRGSFGGAPGLARFLDSAGIDAVIDCTHPFALTMKDNARIATAAREMRFVALRRPDWPRSADDNWIVVDDAAGAVAALATLGPRIFLTLGQRDLDAFAGLAARFFLVRLIESPREFPFADGALVLDRGPFTLDAELALMRRMRIDVLVTKASGGAATFAKIDAARQLRLPVVMIRRRQPPDVPSVESVAAAVAWIEATLGLVAREAG